MMVPTVEQVLSSASDDRTTHGILLTRAQACYDGDTATIALCDLALGRTAGAAEAALARVELDARTRRVSQ